MSLFNTHHHIKETCACFLSLSIIVYSSMFSPYFNLSSLFSCSCCSSSTGFFGLLCAAGAFLFLFAVGFFGLFFGVAGVDGDVSLISGFTGSISGFTFPVKVAGVTGVVGISPFPFIASAISPFPAPCIPSSGMLPVSKFGAAGCASDISGLAGISPFPPSGVSPPIDCSCVPVPSIVPVPPIILF